MHTIQVSVRDKIATQTDGTVIINGNSDYNIEFDFDAEWADLNNKIGIFAYNDAAAHKWAYQPVMFSGNTCAVPILRDIHCVYVGVTAGNVRVTTPAKVQCRLSISDYADTEEPPSADIWGQILAKLDELQTEIDEIKAGGVGGTPDWAQNDPNGAGYIKNRCGGYDDVQTKESELMSINCPADKNDARAYADSSFFPPSAGDIVSVAIDGSTKEYTLTEGTFQGGSVLWFGTQNPSSITDINAFFASDKWFGGFVSYESDIYINILYGSLSETAGKTVGLKQRRVSVVPVKINRRYLDVDETAIKITEKGAIYSPSITDDGSSLGEYAVNLGQGKGGATGAYSFTSGQDTVATANASAAFGNNTTASGSNSAAFGEDSTASGGHSAAFGFNTKASGEFSAAFGYNTKANSNFSAAFGRQTSTTTEHQLVCGRCNDETIGNDYLFVVGSGSSSSAKKNGFAVTSNGEIVMPDPTATPTRYMKARFNSDGTITLIPLADETKSYTTECTANRVTAITAESTDAQYPTAKAVYDALQDIGTPSGTDISLNVTGATVGQTIRVKAVDANGKPTAWEAVDMAAGDTWELLGTLDASSAEVLQLNFPYPVKKLYFSSVLTDSAGEAYTASKTVYRQVAFNVDGTWRDVNGFKIGCSKYPYGWMTRYWLECGADLPTAKGEWASTLSGGSEPLQLTPFHTSTGNNYTKSPVSGIRFSLNLSAAAENTASGSIEVWGVKA